jgi:hypothetical protein
VWSGTLAASVLIVTVQMMAFVALGLALTSILPRFAALATTLVAFLLSHAASAVAVRGTGSLAEDCLRSGLKFLPRFADLTPSNLLDAAGRLSASAVVLAAGHGLAVSVVLVALGTLALRRHDL